MVNVTHREKSDSHMTKLICEWRQDHIQRLQRYNLFEIVKASIPYLITYWEICHGCISKP